jgi:hypothetical protein
MLPAEAHELISSWFASKSVPDISFRESFPSAHDPQDDDRVIYEAIFEPRTLDEPRILDRDGVLPLLDALSDGKLLLNVRTFFGVLDGIRPAMSENDRQVLKLAGYDDFDWIAVARERFEPLKFGIVGTRVRFRPWQ